MVGLGTEPAPLHVTLSTLVFLPSRRGFSQAKRSIFDGVLNLSNWTLANVCTALDEAESKADSPVLRTV